MQTLINNYLDEEKLVVGDIMEEFFNEHYNDIKEKFQV